MIDFIKRKLGFMPEYTRVNTTADGIFVSRQAYEGMMNVLRLHTDMITCIDEEALFDKILELMEEQQCRLQNRVKNLQDDLDIGDNFGEFDDALSDAMDWDMTLNDLKITMGRVDREN
jgi:hypothetical protein